MKSAKETDLTGNYAKIRELINSIAVITNYTDYNLHEIDLFTVQEILNTWLSSWDKIKTQQFMHSVARITDLSKVDVRPGGPPVVSNAATNTANATETSGTVVKADKMAQAGSADTKYDTVYARYIIVPQTIQRNFVDVYDENGNLVTTQTIDAKLNVLLQNAGSESYSYTTNMIDIRNPQYSDYADATLIEWKTLKDLDSNGNAILHDSMPAKSNQKGTTLGTISGLGTEETVYVHWKVIKTINSTTNTNAVVIPQWRLSRYNSELTYTAQAGMLMSLRGDSGHAYSYITPSGSYSYSTINPNGLITDNSIYNPLNQRFTDYLHSKAITKGSYNVSHSKSSAWVDISGTVNLIKSTYMTGINAASWANNYNLLSGLQKYDIGSSAVGTAYEGKGQIDTSNTLTYKIRNNDTYTHYYGVSADNLLGCFCYTLAETITPTSSKVNYIPATYTVSGTMYRFATADTSSRLFKSEASKYEVNGRTILSEQGSAVLNVYPEVPMLFENDQGDQSLVFAAGDLARQIQPVNFHTMQYTAYVKPTSNPLAMATDYRAKAKAAALGLGSTPITYKGASINTSFDVKVSDSSNSKGILTIKSYVLDIADSNLKSTWGNDGYNAKYAHKDFVDSWNFAGVSATEKLIVDAPNGGSATNYTGPDVYNTVGYTQKNESSTEHTLIIRGGVLRYVDNVPVETLVSSDPELYEALVGMKLVGDSKDATVLATFEANKGAVVTEDDFVSKALEGRNWIGDITKGNGWYTEDSANVLVIREYTTTYELPSSFFGDKLPMTIKGLETPMDKTKFFSSMAKGHTELTYTLSTKSAYGNLGVVKCYFEANSKTGGAFCDASTQYAVGNCAVTDTTSMGW